MYCFWKTGQFRSIQYIGDNNILPEDNVKILGLNVDNKLNFNTLSQRFVKQQVEKNRFYQDFLMYSTSPVRCYYAIALLNAILITVQLYDILPVTEIRIKLRRFKRKH